MTDDHFGILDGVLRPQPWMQLRRVAGAEKPSVSKTYDASGGTNKNETVHTVQALWTNNTPIPQWVYGMVTRGGAAVSLQARSRGYLASYHAADVTPTPTPPGSFDLVEISRFGCGLDAGKGGLLAVGTGFAIQEVRTTSTTSPFMPHWAYWVRVEPGETFHAQVQLRFVSEFWEDTLIDGGDASTHSGFISGETILDLFAVPAITDPGPRLVPTVISSATGLSWSGTTSVTVPTAAAGDVILAVVANQWGNSDEMNPVQAGWTLIHTPAGTSGFWGSNNVHMKVYRRISTGSEPAAYTFTGGFFAEQIAALVVVRDASPNLDDGWAAASTVSKNWWQRDDAAHVAPSIDRNGQLILCVSYVPHAGSQTISQTSPDGMTELIEREGDLSNMCIAALASPPRPTQTRRFTPSAEPVWTGRSAALTILIPGDLPS